MLNTPYREGIAIPLMVAISTVIEEGELVAINADGAAVPATDTGAVRLMGRAESTVTTDATQANTPITITRNREYLLANDATNPVTAADIGTTVVLKGKNTIAKPEVGDTATALAVGMLTGVDYNGKAWVSIGGDPLGVVGILAW